MTITRPQMETGERGIRFSKTTVTGYDRRINEQRTTMVREDRDDSVYCTSSISLSGQSRDTYPLSQLRYRQGKDASKTLRHDSLFN